MKKVFFCRAMDLLQFDEIKEQYDNVESMLSELGFEQINKFGKMTFSAVTPNTPNADLKKNASEVVHYALERIKQADYVLADLSKENHFYFGSVCEIVYAKQFNKKVVICTGNANNDKRLWLHYHADYVCETMEQAIQYIKDCEKELHNGQ